MKKTKLFAFAGLLGLTLFFTNTVTAGQAPDGFSYFTGRQIADTTELNMALESGETPISCQFVYWETASPSQKDTISLVVTDLNWKLAIPTSIGSTYDFWCILDNGFGGPSSHGGDFSAMAATTGITTTTPDLVTIQAAKNQLVVNTTESGNLMVYNYGGQLIAQAVVEPGTSYVPVTNAGTNIYLVALVNKEGIMVKKSKVLMVN